MIPRYSRPEMVAIWSPETRFRIWFEIEAHATDALAELGIVPKAAAVAIWEKGWQGRVRCRADRRDRGRHQARRHRVSDASGRDHWAGSTVPASGHDLVGRARHDACGAAQPRFGHPHRRSRAAAGRAEDAGQGAQILDHDRPLARHPCRADHFRHQAGAGPCRVRARQGAADQGARRSRPAPFRAPSAPSPISTRGSKRMWPSRWASRSRRSRRR